MRRAGVDEPRYLFGGWIAARVAMAMFAGVAAGLTYFLAVRRCAVSSPTTSLVTAAERSPLAG